MHPSNLEEIRKARKRKRRELEEYGTEVVGVWGEFRVCARDIGGLAVGVRGKSYKYGWGLGLISHQQECCTTHALNNM